MNEFTKTFLGVLLVVGIGGVLVKYQGKEDRVQRLCEARCGSQRSKVMDKKCYCAHPWGWHEHGKKIKFKVPPKQKTY